MPNLKGNYNNKVNINNFVTLEQIKFSVELSILVQKDCLLCGRLRPFLGLYNSAGS